MPKRTARKRPMKTLKALVSWPFGALVKTASHPLFAMLTALVTLVAGVCASLFTDNIRTSLKGLLESLGNLDGAVYFWFFVLLAGVLFWGNQAASGHLQNRARRELEAAVRRLNTLPSEIFLPNYKDYWDEASRTTLTCIVASNSATGLKISEIEQAIRLVLFTILEAAKDFDGKNNNVVYSANLMLWRDGGSGVENAGATRLAAVSEEDAGYLELIPDLSATSPKQGGRDDRTSAILLPIPKDRQHFVADNGMELLVMLPGAPHTFSSGNPSIFPTIHSFLELLNHKTTLDERIKRRVSHYFTKGTGKHIRSFASFAVMPMSTNAQLPFGVLNLHSQEQGMLADNGDTLFSPLLAPFLTLLSVLISLRNGALSKNPTSGTQPQDNTLDSAH